MDTEIIFSNEYFKIFILSDGLYIESFKAGLSLNQVYEIITSHPEIRITDFNSFKNSIIAAPKPPQKFGELKERIVISVSEDGLTATATYNLPKDQLEIKKREFLIKETYNEIFKKDITIGIKKDLFHDDIENSKAYIVAEGMQAIDGTDCIVKMYKLDEPTPQIRDDGKVNFYELKLINKVTAGEWLGERRDATPGIPGKNVYGKTINAVNGRNFPLLYDKNTVFEIPQNGMTFLYSKIAGAVSYCDGKISISNHLEIDGDVDFKTGNIKFDGYVTIKGTVMDGFSVEATKDIEINSSFGLGNVKSIISTGGSIFIKGGIASKNPVEIKAKKNVFIKFADNSKIICGGIAHIGFYAINSDIEAKEIVVESIKGSIIGGRTKAEIKINVPIVGSQLEIHTFLEVKGFDRIKLSEQLDNATDKINNLKNQKESLKQALAEADSKDELSPFDVKEYNRNFQKVVALKEEIKAVEEEKKNLIRYLRTKGEGEIAILKKIYPFCFINIKNIQTETKTIKMPLTYYVQDGELIEL